MRFLHTSDWHLGKIIYEHSLIEDQEYFLSQLLQTIQKAKDEDKPYSGVFVSGDIYDRAVPPAEATQLFSSFLCRINQLYPDLKLFLISGNHDSAVRLNFASEILNKQNIFLCTDTKKITEPVLVQTENEKVCVYLLPFLNPLSITPENKDEKDEIFLRGQQELFEEAVKQIQTSHKKDFDGIPSVLCAHLFTLGSTASGSERSWVGTAEQVDTSIFKDFTYGAFGHIHKFQQCDSSKRCFYSGSPLAYHFDDNPETFILDVEITGNETPVVTKIPVKPLHKMQVLEGDFSKFYGAQADKEIIQKHKDDYIQVLCTDKAMPTGAFALLQENFPHILNFVPKSIVSGQGSSSIEERKRIMSGSDPVQIYRRFIKDCQGDVELDHKEEELFSTLAKKYSWEGDC